LSFIATASDHGRSGAIELGEIGACFNVLRRELNGLFELRDYFLGETETGKRSTVIGLVSIGATEPEVILGDVGLELNCAFAVCDGVVVVLSVVVGLAQLAERFSVPRIRSYCRRERLDGFIDAARIEHGGDGVGGKCRNRT